MNCPKCGCADFDGDCSRCGHRAAAIRPGIRAASPRRRVIRSSESLLLEFAREQPAAPAHGEWREELKKKLLEVQQKRGRAQPAPLPAEQQPSLLSKTPLSPKVPEIRRSAVDPQPAARSGQDIPKSLRDFQASIQSALPERRSQPAVRVWKQPAAEKRSAQAVAAGLPEPARVVAESGAAEPESQGWIVRKSILLTRTLSGLIDLLIVAGCSAFFLWVSVRCGDIDILSPSFRPVVWGGGFFFQISYSLFFLALTERTVGMMLTGLKVVHEQSQPARFHQLLLRTLLFFLSWATLMLGLLWGLWDRRSRCMHDCFSHTVVVRC